MPFRPLWLALARGTARFDFALARGTARFDFALARGTARFDTRPRWRTGWLLGALVALALLLGRSPARAAEGEAFSDAVRRAVVEFDQAHWEEASALFRRAHTLNPSARTWRGLGLTSFELRHYVDAIAELEAALADPRKPLTSPQRREVESVLKRAREFVSVYRVHVIPPGAAVLVDGHPVELSHGDLLLDPGPHTVLIKAPGYQERREDLRAAAGVEDELSIELSVLAPPPEPAAEPALSGPLPAPREAARAPRGRVWSWVLGGAALAAGGTALGLGAATAHRQGELAGCDGVDGGAHYCAEIAHQGKALQFGTNLSAGIAGALLVGSVTAFVLAGRGRSAREKHAKLLLSPSGAGVQGRF